jgi:hypothetical protein
MTECIKCGKALKPIGSARANSKQKHEDWATRKYHKTCWKEIKNFSYIYNKCQQIENLTLSDILLEKILH